MSQHDTPYSYFILSGLKTNLEGGVCLGRRACELGSLTKRGDDFEPPRVRWEFVHWPATLNDACRIGWAQPLHGAFRLPPTA